MRIKPREQEDADSGSAFASAPWLRAVVDPQTAPPGVLAVPSPTAAMPPPLPFRLLGRYLDDGRQAVFLQFNDQNLVVRAGDTIAEQYKVESLDESTLTLLHLPTNQHQTLNIGAVP